MDVTKRTEEPISIGQTLAQVRSWVDSIGPEVPGLRAAHVKGSILDRPSSAAMPGCWDVDVNLVITGRARDLEFRSVPCGSLLLDVALVSDELYGSPEAVLASPALAPNLRDRRSVLADSDGHLGRIQRIVESEFGRRRWVAARCAEKQRLAHQHLGRLEAARHPAPAGLALWGIVQALGAQLALAALRPPTHRRNLVVLREVAAERGRPDLHQRAVGLLGCAALDLARVEALLAGCADLFDRAAALPGSGVEPRARPHVVDGTRELIVAGDHREAVHWIAAQTMQAAAPLQTHGTAADRNAAQEQSLRLLQALGLLVPGAVAARSREAQALAADFARFAAEIVAEHPEEALGAG